MNQAGVLQVTEYSKSHDSDNNENSQGELLSQFPVVDGSEEEDFEVPTEEDLASLRRVRGKIPWVAYSVAFIELCERFSYYGTTAVCESNLSSNLFLQGRRLEQASKDSPGPSVWVSVLPLVSRHSMPSGLI